MKEASNKKTQRVKVTQYGPLYLLLLSTKKQVDSNRENTDESKMFKENIIFSTPALYYTGPLLHRPYITPALYYTGPTLHRPYITLVHITLV